MNCTALVGFQRKTAATAATATTTATKTVTTKKTTTKTAVTATHHVLPMTATFLISFTLLW
jgi:hypothetical protein